MTSFEALDEHLEKGPRFDTTMPAGQNRDLRWPGIEPGSTAWKAAMLTTIPPSLGI